MTHSRTIAVALLLFTLVAMLAACGGAEPTLAPTAAPRDTTAPTDTPVPPTDTPQPAEETTPGETSEASPEGTELNPEDLAAPSALTSYRATMRMTVSGTEAGEAVDSSLEFFTEYTSEPEVLHVQMSGEGVAETDTTGTGSVDMYQLADTTYIQFGDQWLSVPTSAETAANTSIIEPDQLLGDTCGWQQQADTEYEGIDAYHWTMSTEDVKSCTSTEMLGAMGDIAEASGELYVAKEGNYVIHMEMVLAGEEFEATLGTEDQVMDEGRMEITFDMRDVNEPFTIEIPAEALASGSLPEDIPVPEDAEELSNAFGMITYKTTRTPAEMNEYYKTELSRLGWTEVSAAEYSGVFMLEYSREGRTASVNINADEDSGKTSVLIMIQEPES